MQLTVTCSNRQFDIEVAPGTPSSLHLDGERFQATLYPIDHSPFYTLLIGHQVYELAITEFPNGELMVAVDGILSTIRIEDRLTAAMMSAGARPRAKPGKLVIRAPMAGRVTSVAIDPGQKVASEELLIILEAMKMETTIMTPQGGTVERIAVHEGETVARDDELVVVDTESSTGTSED